MSNLWVQQEPFPPHSPSWETAQIAFYYQWFNQNLLEVETPEALMSPEWVPGSHNAAVAMTAWQFAHSVKIGDFVTFGQTWQQAWIGQVVGEYQFMQTDTSHAHIRKVKIIAHFEDRLTLPKNLWGLFSGNSRLVTDPTQIQALTDAIAAGALATASNIHLLFEEAGDTTSSSVLGDLALTESEDRTPLGPVFCDRCQQSCTELIYIDYVNDTLNRPLYPWSAFSEIHAEMTECIGEPWLRRAPNETNLSLARRYIDVRLEDWSNDLDFPILIGLRRDDTERWLWIFVQFSGRGAIPSVVDQIIPTRTAAEEYLLTQGFRSSEEVSADRLRLLGIADPLGHAL